MNLKAFRRQYEIDFLESRELKRNQHSLTVSALDHSDHWPKPKCFSSCKTKTTMATRGEVSAQTVCEHRLENKQRLGK